MQSYTRRREFDECKVADDFDGDGKPELAVANSSSGNIRNQLASSLEEKDKDSHHIATFVLTACCGAYKFGGS